jgi:hypothetical protein
MINYDLPEIIEYTMTEDQYTRWWARFRGTGFDKERTEHFDSSNY